MVDPGLGFVWLEEVGLGDRPRALVVPVASVENHGVLPAGSDVIIARCFLERLAGRMKGARFLVAGAPVVPYSVAVEHEALGYTVTADAQSFLPYLTAVLVSAARLAQRVYVPVMHGGAYSVVYAAARAARRRSGALVRVYSFWDAVARALQARGVPPYPIHADPVEASILAACGSTRGVEVAEPEAVLEEARRRAERLRGLPLPWLGEDAADVLYPTAAVPASPSLGEELLREAVEGLASVIEGDFSG